MSKNVHDVRKVFLETTLCVYVCFVKFSVFLLYEIHLRGVKLIENLNCIGNIWEIIPKGHLRVLDEGPKTVAKIVPSRPQTTEQSTDHGPLDTV